MFSLIPYGLSTLFPLLENTIFYPFSTIFRILFPSLSGSKPPYFIPISSINGLKTP